MPIISGVGSNVLMLLRIVDGRVVLLIGNILLLLPVFIVCKWLATLAYAILPMP